MVIFIFLHLFGVSSGVQEDNGNEANIDCTAELKRKQAQQGKFEKGLIKKYHKNLTRNLQFH